MQPDQINTSAVALQIARVIARKHIESDRRLSKLDPLGKASAITTMANRMWDELDEEAEAAVREVLRQLAEPEPEAA